MSDLTPETLAELRRTHKRRSATPDNEVILDLIDALESAHTARDEAQMERSDARAEVERLTESHNLTMMDRDKWYAEVKRLRGRVAEVAGVAEERGYDVQELKDEKTRLRAKVRELADSWDDPDPERGDPDRADALRAMLADKEA